MAGTYKQRDFKTGIEDQSLINELTTRKIVVRGKSLIFFFMNIYFFLYFLEVFLAPFLFTVKPRGLKNASILFSDNIQCFSSFYSQNKSFSLLLFLIQCQVGFFVVLIFRKIIILHPLILIYLRYGHVLSYH